MMLDSADEPFEIRTATAESLRGFLEPLVPAFAEEYSDAEFEADRNVFEPDRIIAAFEDERSVGCAGAYSLGLTVPGGEVPAAGVTVVAVLPTHRRRGILRGLMRHQLDDIHRRGEPVAILWASEGAIYQRFGYGLATYAGTFELDPRRSSFLRPVDPAGTVRYVGPDEALALFPPLYERIRPGIPGALARSEAWWRWGTLRDYPEAAREQGPKSLVALESGGRTIGYAIYRARSTWDDRGPDNRLTVLEVLAEVPDAELRLWRWLLDIDLVGRVRAVRQPVPPPLFFALAEPRRLGLTVGDALWLRLIDLPAALSARRYSTRDSLVLEVSDAGCAWNAGRWRLAAEGPGDGVPASVEPTGEEPDLVLDTADLASAYLGGVRFSDLAAAGRVGERRAGAIARADRLFCAARAPWCSTMF